jgi:hypothetical protein
MRQKFGPTTFNVTGSGTGQVSFSPGRNGTCTRLLITPPNSTVTATWQAVDADQDIVDFGYIPGGLSSYSIPTDANWLNVETFKIVGASQNGNGWKVSGWLK